VGRFHRAGLGSPYISRTLGLHENEVVKYLEPLCESGQVRVEQYGEQLYSYH